MQPSVGKWFPVALMVGLLAGFSVWLSGALSQSWPWFGAVWGIFIAWGLWFAGGAKMSRLHKYALSLIGGVFFGWLTLYIYMGYFIAWFGDPWALPLTVVIIATTIIMLELTSWFEVGYAQFFAYAGYFAYVFGGFGGEAGLFTQGIYFSVILMVGLGFGIATTFFKTRILNIERVPFDQRQTIYDKEN